jgi:hypothetical protein
VLAVLEAHLSIPPLTTARTTAFIPALSPPEVNTANFILLAMTPRAFEERIQDQNRSKQMRTIFDILAETRSPPSRCGLKTHSALFPIFSENRPAFWPLGPYEMHQTIQNNIHSRQISAFTHAIGWLTWPTNQPEPAHIQCSIT